MSEYFFSASHAPATVLAGAESPPMASRAIFMRGGCLKSRRGSRRKESCLLARTRGVRFPPNPNLFFNRAGNDLTAFVHAGLLVDTMTMMTVSRLRINVETRRFPSVRGPACAQAHFRCFTFRSSHKYQSFVLILLSASQTSSPANVPEVSGGGW